MNSSPQENNSKQIQIQDCDEIKSHLKTCLRSTTFYGKWIRGDCEQLRESLISCNDAKFKEHRERNLKEARARNDRWKKANESIGLANN